MTAAMKAPEGGVAVRMYRPRGLGDCFLLAFPGAEGEAVYVLIDCGVFYGTSGGAKRLRAIAADVAAATGGHLDVLVATHEHWDHLCGFHFAEEVFSRLSIGEVWLAWTEDPGHPVGKRLREQRRQASTALRMAAAELARFDPAERAAAGFDAVLDFFGPSDPADPFAGLGFSAGTAAQMELVSQLSAKPRYHRPGGAPQPLAGAPGVRVYVLGPPEDPKLLTRSSPLRRRSEVYEDRETLSEELAFFAAIGAAAEADRAVAGAGEDDSRFPFGRVGLGERSQPFAPDLRLDLCHVESAARSRREANGGKIDPETARFFREHYGFGKGLKTHGAQWRRIGSAWLGTAERLALQLDSNTNNTSLALAIELADGRVLLFPADAQVGNCLSWHAHEWTVDGSKVTARDLLERTVLYKVGHHGSHNATLREKGLEMMCSPDLVAMLPVDGAQAADKGWAMPFPPLYRRLLEKTRGRVLRADEALASRPSWMPADEWQRVSRGQGGAFAGRWQANDLWIELTL